MPEEHQTLWGFPVVISDKMTPGTAVIGELPKVYDLTINNKIFLDAHCAPNPGVEFTIEDHPLFKGVTFKIISTEQAHKLGYTLVRVVIVKEQSLA